MDINTIVVTAEQRRCIIAIPRAVKTPSCHTNQLIKRSPNLAAAVVASSFVPFRRHGWHAQECVLLNRTETKFNHYHALSEKVSGSELER